jgi:hypothetical protein
MAVAIFLFAPPRRDFHFDFQFVSAFSAVK